MICYSRHSHSHNHHSLIPSFSSAAFTSHKDLIFISLYSSLMALLIILAATFIAFSSSSTAQTLSSSTISAAPSVSPDYISPSSSSSSPPALSPDISPLFPSPSGSELSPTVPFITSSPSPPNPDAMEEAPGPGDAFSPSQGLPESSSGGLNVAVFLTSMVVVFAGFGVNQDFVSTF